MKAHVYGHPGAFYELRIQPFCYYYFHCCCCLLAVVIEKEKQHFDQYFSGFTLALSIIVVELELIECKCPPLCVEGSDENKKKTNGILVINGALYSL